MTSRTHIACGVSLAACASFLIKDSNVYEMILFSVIGSTVCDLDNKNAWVSKICPIAFYSLFKNNNNFMHRTFVFHRLIPLLAMTFMFLNVFSSSVNYNNNVTIGFAIGCISHQILDYSIKYKYDKIVFVLSWIFMVLLLLYKLFL